MKKYRVLISGTNYVTAESEDKAIEHTQKKIDMIHKSLNMSVLAISEVREEE
jgi:prefoldin subunit 5